MKKTILAILVTAVIVGSIGVYAGTQINASQVTYTDSNNNETTVDTALDNLYTTADKPILKKYVASVRAQGLSSTRNAIANFIFFNTTSTYYKYFKVTTLTEQGDYTAACIMKAWSGEQSKAVDIDLNTEYEINSSTDGYKFTEFNLYTRSTEDNKQSKCSAILEMYNK